MRARVLKLIEMPQMFLVYKCGMKVDLKRFETLRFCFQPQCKDNLFTAEL